MRGIPGMPAPPPDASDAAAERIAAVYDERIVAQALERKHNIAFFAIHGPIGPGARLRRAIEALAESIFGVDKGSTRVSLDAASLSLAFDPARVAFGAMQKALDRKLADRRLSLLPMRIVDE